MKTFKAVNCGAVALAAVLAGTFAQAVTVSTVAELTNAIATAKSPITLKPGVYDLSTLEYCVVSNGSDFALGTNYDAGDGRGLAHIVFKKTTVFQGENTKHWSQKTPEEETIIRGGGANDTMRLVYGYTGGGRSSTWSHITFESGGASDADGGAIFVTDPHMMKRIAVSNCVFRNNRANIGGATYGLSVADTLYENNTALKGGAACAVYSTAGGGFYSNTFERCIFRGNVSTGSGAGAIYAGKYAIVSGCTFTNNAATGNGSGGALRMENETGMTVRNCTFVDNSAAVQGGAVQMDGVLGGFENCTFLRNAAKRGGAVWADSAVGTIENCQVISNTASESGVAIASVGGMRLPSLDHVANTTFAFNSSAGEGAGLVVTNFAKGGTVSNCLFESNVGAANNGSHVCGVTNVVNSIFRGSGDMIAKSYDRCVFERCSFDYDNWGGGMILFNNSTGPGYLRNCLFTNNTAHVYIDNASGAEVEIANCTFADNLAKSALNQGDGRTMNSGNILYAFRGGNDGTGKPLPSTNRVVNCIFANNTWRGGLRQDVSAYRTGTSVAVPADNLLINCLYEKGVSTNAATLVDPIVAKPGFVAGDPRYADQPPCMLRRASAARKAGLVLPWMAGATDYAGAPMVSAGGTVDLGAYQCTLPEVGAVLLVR